MIPFLRFLFRRRGSRYYPSPHRMRRFLHWLSAQAPLARLGLRVGLTLIAVAHLVGVALLPAGRNPLFSWEAPGPLKYLTLAPVGDTMGFYKTGGSDRFLVYRIFTEGGTVVEGAFPDPGIVPRLRYDRWAMFGHEAGGDSPIYHAMFLDYLVQRLPAPPLKVEMLAARWEGMDGAWGGAPKVGNRKAEMTLQKLGTYDGLRRIWLPVEKRGKP